MSWEGLAMTLNKSLFNLGIFKNTIYRFKWGSFLYFVALFFSVPFMILVEDFDRLVQRFVGSSYYRAGSIIIRSDLLTVPLILAVIVPTVVAVLVFNNVHSGKQGVFTHGLPTDRRAGYISNIAAAFVLMFVPVLINAVILMLMSFGKYGQVISSMSVIYWTGININMLFVMFSVAVFSAFLTGNIAAHIGINVFIHLIPMIIAWAIYLISQQLLYGFHQADNFIANELVNNNPVVWLFGRALSEDAIFAKLQTWIYIIGAAVMYVIAYILYKNRKIEACGDVSAFKTFKPILKYAVVSGAAIALFGMLLPVNMKLVPMIIVILAITAIVYFAAEMLMNKSFRVFKTAYKGYCGFVLCCAVFIGFFAYTSVFGYETRIPKTEQIESASVQRGWNGTATFDDPQLIESTVKLHTEIISDIPAAVDYYQYDGDFQNMTISYKLKDGGILQRRYAVSTQMFDKAMSEMYRSKDYKLRITEIDNINVENVNSLVLNAYCSAFSYNISLNDDAAELMKAIKKDVEELSYEEMEKDDNVLNIRVDFGCSAEENLRLNIFKNIDVGRHNQDIKYIHRNFDLRLNSNFKNAYAFLKEKGYYDHILEQLGQNLVICDKVFYREGDICRFKGDKGEIKEFIINSSDLKMLSAADQRLLAETMATSKRGELPQGAHYLVFAGLNNIEGNIMAMDYAMTVKAESLPKYLDQYVEK